MADKHSIIITSTTPSGKTNQKAISFVNPNATSAAMKKFATAINATTENTISAVERVDRVDITNAKLDPQLTLTPDTVEVQQLVEGGSVTVNINHLGNGTLSISGVRPAIAGSAVLNGKTLTITGDPVWPEAPKGDATATLTVTLGETEEYSAATAIFTYTNFAEEDRDVTFDDI